VTENVTNSSGSILEPVERISETLFALIMVLTFTCSFGVLSEGKVRTRIKQLATAALFASLAAAQTSSSGDDNATKDSSAEPWSYYINIAG
jgi:hypothetical protein